MTKFKYNLSSLVGLVTVVCIGFGVWSWLTPDPVQYPALKIDQDQDGKPFKYRVWILARPLSKQYTEDEQTYQEIDWSCSPFVGVEKVPGSYHFKCWSSFDDPCFAENDPFFEKFPIGKPSVNRKHR